MTIFWRKSAVTGFLVFSLCFLSISKNAYAKINQCTEAVVLMGALLNDKTSAALKKTILAGKSDEFFSSFSNIKKAAGLSGDTMGNAGEWSTNKNLDNKKTPEIGDVMVLDGTYYPIGHVAMVTSVITTVKEYSDGNKKTIYTVEYAEMNTANTKDENGKTKSGEFANLILKGTRDISDGTTNSGKSTVTFGKLKNMKDNVTASDINNMLNSLSDNYSVVDKDEFKKFTETIEKPKENSSNIKYQYRKALIATDSDKYKKMYVDAIESGNNKALLNDIYNEYSKPGMTSSEVAAKIISEGFLKDPVILGQSSVVVSFLENKIDKPSMEKAILNLVNAGGYKMEGMKDGENDPKILLQYKLGILIKSVYVGGESEFKKDYDKTFNPPVANVDKKNKLKSKIDELTKARKEKAEKLTSARQELSALETKYSTAEQNIQSLEAEKNGLLESAESSEDSAASQDLKEIKAIKNISRKYHILRIKYLNAKKNGTLSQQELSRLRKEIESLGSRISPVAKKLKKSVANFAYNIDSIISNFDSGSNSSPKTSKETELRLKEINKKIAEQKGVLSGLEGKINSASSKIDVIENDLYKNLSSLQNNVEEINKIKVSEDKEYTQQDNEQNDDYLTENKEQEAQKAEDQASENDSPEVRHWGYVTKNFEKKSDGTLTMWGGHFGGSEGGGIEMDIDDNRSVKGIYHSRDSSNGELVTENINQNIENMDVTNNSEGGLRYVTDGHYTYTSWGHWSKPGGVYTDVNNGAGIEHKIDNSLWVVGQEIDPNDMPKSGSARYLGVAQGHYYTGDLGTTGGIYGGALNGTVDIAANFANNTVSGDLNLGKVGGGHFANASFAGASINKSHFNGSLTSSDLSPGSQHPNNSIKGSFYGPGASEVGGIFAAKNTNGEFATGTFAGKK